MSKAGHVTITESVPLDKYLERLDLLVRGQALKKALDSAGKVVAKAAAANVPRGSQTGTSKKLSKKQQAAKAKRKPLADAIGVVTRSYKDGVAWVAVVGGKKPGQYHGHLLEGGHKGVYWGRSRGDYVAAKRWLAPAVDSTKQQQNAAVISSLEKSIASVR